MSNKKKYFKAKLKLDIKSSCFEKQKHEEFEDGENIYWYHFPSWENTY